MLLRATSSGLFWFFCLGIAVFSLAVAALVTAMGTDQAAPHLLHYVADHRVPLYLHIVFGPVALLLLPFQFWAGLRNRNRRVHRSLGYLYVVSVAFAALGALLLLPRFAGSAWATAGFALLATLWLVTTARAVLFARAGRTDEHRAWMMRSAALTFAAVVLRLMTLPLMGTGMSLTQSYDVTAWASWMLPLMVVEWRLRRSLPPTPAQAT
jgi:uncharacterized membrane protein